MISNNTDTSMLAAALAGNTNSDAASLDASSSKESAFSDQLTRIEAEEMRISGYRQDANTLASGGAAITLAGGGSRERGSARTKFNGITGTYDIVVAHTDAKDSLARFQLQSGRDVLSTWKLDQAPSGNASSGNNNIVRRTVVEDVFLEKGTDLKLIGRERGSDGAGIDYIEFVPVGGSEPVTGGGDPTPPPADPTPPPADPTPPPADPTPPPTGGGDPTPPPADPTPPPADPTPPPADPTPPSTGGGGKADGVTLWSALQPKAGEQVVIAKGETVLLDTDTANLAGVIVEGKLKFSEDFTDTNNNGGLDFTADWLLVRNGGHLEIGTETNAFDPETTITLDGADVDVMGMGMGGRFLGVMGGGTLDIHGNFGDDAGEVTWTQLNGHADAGSNSITLAKATGWKVGDEIVIAPSGYEADEAEKRVIKGISNGGKTFQLDKALDYDHWGTIETVEGKQLDMRAEVGLLTRNIKIQSPENSVNDKFGFHGMVMQGTTARISGVEMVRGGQVGKQGRYPFHWHLAGEGSGEYIKNSAVHDSFHRGIVTHGVNDVEVDSNVVYNVTSHAYIFAEDGTETGNTFTNNLAMLVKNPSRYEFAFPVKGHFKSSQAETRSSGFWGLNPYNPMVGNHAAGSVDGNGFFIDSVLLDNKTRLAISRSTETNVFKDNVAHSNMISESATNPHYGPLTRGHGLMVNDYTSAKNTKPELVFEGFTAYKNNNSGAWMEDNRHVLKDAIIADSNTGVIFKRSHLDDVVMMQNSVNKIGGSMGVERAFFTGGRAKPGGIFTRNRSQGIDPTFKNVTFVDFDAALVVGQGTRFNEGSSISGSKLVNIGKALHWSKSSKRPLDNSGMIVDLDGSLTGTGKRTAISGTQISGGTFIPEWKAYIKSPF
ncbi:MAG: G8 domain-containing protein [Cyanobacteria bacterium J06635_1]